MFDSFAFSEVVVICVVALVVLGPTRLPGVVRKLGRWMGKARAMARDFRQQLENEVTLEELNRMTEKQSRRDPPPAQAAPADDAATSTDAAPQPGDDTYSHAHAEGEAPMPPDAEAAPPPAAVRPDPAPSADAPLDPDPAAPASDRTSS